MLLFTDRLSDTRVTLDDSCVKSSASAYSTPEVPTALVLFFDRYVMTRTAVGIWGVVVVFGLLVVVIRVVVVGGGSVVVVVVVVVVKSSVVVIVAFSVEVVDVVVVVKAVVVPLTFLLDGKDLGEDLFGLVVVVFRGRGSALTYRNTVTMTRKSIPAVAFMMMSS